MEKVNVYIDGPNLLGAVSETLRKRIWLDPFKLANFLIDVHTQKVEKIYYAETPYPETSFQLETFRKQQSFFGHLHKYIQSKQIVHIRGHYRIDKMKVPQYILSGLNPSVQKLVASLVWTRPVEKGGDVGLAVRLVRDAFQGNFDHAILVTEDQDFAPAIRIALSCQGKKVSISYVNNSFRNAIALRNQCEGAGFIQITRSNINNCALETG